MKFTESSGPANNNKTCTQRKADTCNNTELHGKFYLMCSSCHSKLQRKDDAYCTNLLENIFLRKTVILPTINMSSLRSWLCKINGFGYVLPLVTESSFFLRDREAGGQWTPNNFWACDGLKVTTFYYLGSLSEESSCKDLLIQKIDQQSV